MLRGSEAALDLTEPLPRTKVVQISKNQALKQGSYRRWFPENWLKPLK
tara:strand:- start:124 stop:267 length:144 start_codon:yes stop_codon:yes gene_type:complete